jgi:putative ABC transport system permease protein
MKFGRSIHQALLDTRRHWVRSVLTMLGIIMGVTSLMTMQALTEGMTRGFREHIAQTGTNTKAIIRPGPVPARQTGKADLSRGITYDDALALRKQASLLTWVAPVAAVNDETVIRGNKDYQVRWYGAEEGMLQMDKLAIESGRWISDVDLNERKHVCVLGAKTAAALFDNPGEEALGALVRIRGINFRVIGLTPLYLSMREQAKSVSGRRARQEERRKRRGGSWGEWDPFWWKNNYVAIPLTAMLDIMASGDKSMQSVAPGTLSEIQVGFARFEQMLPAKEQIKQILLTTHRGIENFEIIASRESVLEVEEQVRSHSVTGAIVSGISLIVGGLGIVNIMLASVADRTREIGIRMTVGATRRDIFIQTLSEVLVLSIAGGILGIIASFGLMRALEALSPEDNRPIVTIGSVITSLLCAMFVGIAAGLYPARKASSVDPIEAIRVES